MKTTKDLEVKSNYQTQVKTKDVYAKNLGKETSKKELVKTLHRNMYK